MTDQAFERCLPHLLKNEGGNDDDPRDHGGRTSRGVTQREYDKWRVKKGLPQLDVWKAPQQDIHDIYYEGYWLPRCPHLHPGVDMVYFSMAVNAGPGRAEEILLHAIGGTDVDTINKFCDLCISFYRDLSQFSIYGRGWLNRIANDRATALKMAQTKESPMASPITTTATTTTTAKAPQGFTLPNLSNIEAIVEQFGGMVGLLTVFNPSLAAEAQKDLPVLEAILKFGAAMQNGTDPGPPLQVLMTAIKTRFGS